MKQLEHCFPAQTDFYKFCHWMMEDTDIVRKYSYCESRVGACRMGKFGKISRHELGYRTCNQWSHSYNILVVRSNS